jgi:cullin-associated NEDD8-dissociated protein 1
VSSEALGVAEQLVKAITPPRSSFVDEKHRALLGNLYQAILDRVTANDADLEVRQRAIHALGVLLARTSGQAGARLIPLPERISALDILRDRLNNEITRLSAVRAIDTVAALASDKKDFKPVWVRTVSLELGAQLRKADRTLRGTSLGALKNLTVNPAGHANLDDKTTLALVDVLIPVLNTNDLHLLGLALVILARLVQGNAKIVVNGELNTALCAVVLAPLSGAVLDAFLILLRSIGEYGVGKPLMQGLLKEVGVAGDPAVVGKAIANLLVSGGSSVGVSVDDFIAELRTAQDDQRKCLALSVLGEGGLRMGESSPLRPALFMSHFKSKSDLVPLAAAVALGRAGAGNVGKFLPVILTAMDDGSNSQYLLLHSIKEILQYSNDTHASVTRHSQQLWDKLLAASQTEDNRAVGAECLGRLTMVDPKTYLPLLKVSDAETRLRLC